tara:strand:+ start:1860 stop:2018 length:159 start_codon:yes stop_codon:yes gene_type:complete
LHQVAKSYSDINTYRSLQFLYEKISLVSYEADSISTQQFISAAKKLKLLKIN